MLDAGTYEIPSGHTLYVQGGGVVKGRLRSTDATNISIRGYGVLDGSSEKLESRSTRHVWLLDCSNVLIENVLLIRPTLWMVVVDRCHDVRIHGIKEVGTVGSSDGIDVVSSRDVAISDCFLRNGDDCVVIKSISIDEDGPGRGSLDVERVTVTGCSLLSCKGGSAMEIGYELSCEHVRDIVFRDCDVLAVHSYGSVFGIHNSDRAVVSNVLYENIRVEHHYDKLIDFRIVSSRWGRDACRGQIRGVTLRNIDVALSIYNDGYSCSIIGGYDADHIVDGINFEGFKLGGKVISNADDLSLFTRRTENISFSQMHPPL